MRQRCETLRWDSSSSKSIISQHNYVLDLVHCWRNRSSRSIATTDGVWKCKKVKNPSHGIKVKNYQLDFVRSCRNCRERSRTTKAGVFDECKKNRRWCLKLPKDVTPSRGLNRVKHHISRTISPILFVSDAIERGDQGEQDMELKCAKEKRPKGRFELPTTPILCFVRPHGSIIPLDHLGCCENFEKLLVYNSYFDVFHLSTEYFI